MNKLEEENKRVHQLANNSEIEDFIRHLDYILGVLEELPESHCARMFFDERFKSGPEVTSYLHQRKYSALMVKSIQYAADLLVNMTRDGARIQSLEQKYRNITNNAPTLQVSPRQRSSSSLLGTKRVNISNMNSMDFGNPTSNREFLETGADSADENNDEKSVEENENVRGYKNTKTSDMFRR